MPEYEFSFLKTEDNLFLTVVGGVRQGALQADFSAYCLSGITSSRIFLKYPEGESIS